MRSSRKRGLRGYLLNKSLTEPIWHYLCSRLRAAVYVEENGLPVANGVKRLVWCWWSKWWIYSALALMRIARVCEC